MTTAICFAWMSKIASAIGADEKTGFWYEQSNICAALPTYGQAPSPIYVDVSE